MEPENHTQDAPLIKQSSTLHRVTPFSKYLAMALFILLPFLGGYIGYMLAPEKVVEVERVVIKEVDAVPVVLEEGIRTEIDTTLVEAGDLSGVSTEIYNDDVRGVSFEYPSNWLIYGAGITTESQYFNARYDFSSQGWGEDMIFVHEDRLDPTHVSISRAYLSPQRIVQNLIEDTSMLDEIEVRDGIVTRVVTPFERNSCIQVTYVHPISDNVSGIVTVSGICPPLGSDLGDLKLAVAEGVQFTAE